MSVNEQIVLLLQSPPLLHQRLLKGMCIFARTSFIHVWSAALQNNRTWGRRLSFFTPAFQSKSKGQKASSIKVRVCWLHTEKHLNYISLRNLSKWSSKSFVIDWVTVQWEKNLPLGPTERENLSQAQRFPLLLVFSECYFIVLTSLNSAPQKHCPLGTYSEGREEQKGHSVLDSGAVAKLSGSGRQGGWPKRSATRPVGRDRPPCRFTTLCVRPNAAAIIVALQSASSFDPCLFLSHNNCVSPPFSNLEDDPLMTLTCQSPSHLLFLCLLIVI